MKIADGDIFLLQKAMERQRIANEVLRFLSDSFREKYGLTPDNAIKPDGTIIGPYPANNGVSNQEGGDHQTSYMQELSRDMAMLRETSRDSEC
jgi:hypothetical protein